MRVSRVLSNPAVLQNIAIDSSTNEEKDESDPQQKTFGKLMEKLNAIENDIGEIKTYVKDSKADLPLSLLGHICIGVRTRGQGVHPPKNLCTGAHHVQNLCGAS